MTVACSGDVVSGTVAVNTPAPVDVHVGLAMPDAMQVT